MPARPTPLPALSAMLFASGAVALVYEVAWQRQFASVFGSAAPATAAVLAAYFAGLGLGALLAGRCAKRVQRPLRAYAVIEAVIGLGALLVTPLLGLGDRLLASAGDPSVGAHFTVAQFGPRVLLAFLALALPTLGMGATLPLLTRAISSHPSFTLGPVLGRLYAVNTAGASLGALALPFALLPWLGFHGSVLAGVSINFLIAGVAWWLDVRTGVAAAPAASSAEQPSRSPSPVKEFRSTEGARRPLSVSLRLGAAFVSGAMTFALQVLWNRAFAQVHENSMHAFAVLVFVVILALALGAAFARVGLGRQWLPRRLLGTAWLAAGIWVLLSPTLFHHLTDGLRYLGDPGAHSSPLLWLLGLCAVTVGLPLVLVGCGFPVLLQECSRDARDVSATADAVGWLLASNIAGAVLGALAAGVVLPGTLGLWPSITACGAILAVAGLRFAVFTTDSRALWLDLACLVAVTLPAVLAQVRANQPLVRLDNRGAEELRFVAEGPHGITAVTERPGSRRLKLNNHYALGGTAATGDERMQAHVPLLLHPAPKQVAFLGLGTGIAAGGTTFHPLEQLTVVELVPEVVTAAREHFRDANQGVLEAARSVVVLDDARHFLRHTDRRFDVIIGDLVVPWRPGEGALFTQEHFVAARDALNDGGLYCQWLPLFQLSEEQFQILTRTFLEVFPRAWVFRGDFSPQQPALALIASRDGKFVPDATVVRRRVGELRVDPANPQLRQAELFWLNCVGVVERSGFAAGTNDARRNTEDRPWVELLGAATLSNDAGNPRGSAFVGRPLQTWMDSVHRSAAEHLRVLPADEAAVLRAAPLLGEMTLQLQLGNEAAVRAAQAELRRALPAAAYQALFGGK